MGEPREFAFGVASRSPGAGPGAPPPPALRTAPAEVDRPETDQQVERDIPWIVIVWNDPINLMSYVTFVLQKVFGYPRHQAEKLMMDVHLKGKAVVSSGSRDKSESDVAKLHAHGLWATMQQDR
jgi:ATP-dependent Clp protease adaptor protein ClpS